MSEPFNLDAVLGEPFTFTFDGAEYVLPVDVPWDVSQLLNDGKAQDAMRILLGDDQWRRLEESPKTFGTRSFVEVVGAYMKHLGLREGESEASPSSSNGTDGQLRPTSSATTTPTSAGSVTVRAG
jgi:hypothetical protein